MPVVTQLWYNTQDAYILLDANGLSLVNRMYQWLTKHPVESFKKLITQHLISIRIKFNVLRTDTNTIFSRSHSYSTSLFIRTQTFAFGIQEITFSCIPFPPSPTRLPSSNVFKNMACISAHVKLDDEFFNIFYSVCFSLCLLSAVLQRPLLSPVWSPSQQTTDMKVGIDFRTAGKTVHVGK